MLYECGRNVKREFLGRYPSTHPFCRGEYAATCNFELRPENVKQSFAAEQAVLYNRGPRDRGLESHGRLDVLTSCVGRRVDDVTQRLGQNTLRHET